MAALSTPFPPQDQQLPPANFHKPHPQQGKTPPDQKMYHNTNSSHQQQSGQPRNGANGRSRISGDQRSLIANGAPAVANGNEAMPVPSGGPHKQLANGHPRGIGGIPGFDGPRSPPGGKNTSHVPCKFYRQGACQAGNSCPFMHSDNTASDQAPCKYFAKGNCKFGAKCALAHILPDGRRVNRSNLPTASAPLNIGGRINPENFNNQGSALHNSLVQANMLPFGHQGYPFPGQEDLQHMHNQPSKGVDTIRNIDNGFPSSLPDSKYGSPRDEGRLPMSPAAKGLSVLDAPLPASLDSNGISWFARHGPIAASVPSKFGMDSSPPSLSLKANQPSDALKSLHDSAFGNDTRGKPTDMGQSPSSGYEESFGQRIMHSQRYSKPKLMSASLPRPGASDDWDSNFTFEEDFLPHALHELLTPQEKMRRFSRTEEDVSGIQRLSLNGIGTPGESSSKVGSPTTSSPSRFGPLFTRHKKEEDSSLPTSGLGHVGSPLRNSSLHPGASPSLRAASGRSSGDVSPYFASPPRQSSMSAISQQLQRARLSRAESCGNESGLYPGTASFGSKHSGTSNRLDRAVSSSSIGASRFVPSIDEEQSDFVFSMEEEDDNKRSSGGWNYPVGGRSPHLGAISSGRNGASGQEAKDGKEYLKEMESLYRR
ncbi:hypothetical protein FGG08_003479 [Glutinoglossum americanum]|uniref:C3H1-type domain-containing protein n=1 Tax=Glutinoglossum americanum TaxID=1670608 RepID=A0A9P8I486_9PEZI|nr:hypothetical protein FGG08_003479 [Glutinoglossum americanum]